MPYLLAENVAGLPLLLVSEKGKGENKRGSSAGSGWRHNTLLISIIPISLMAPLTPV